MTRRLIALDVDGVTADFLAGVKAELASVPETECPAGWRDVPAAGQALAWNEGLSPILKDWLWRRVNKDPIWWERLPPVPAVRQKLVEVAASLAILKVRHRVVWATCRRSDGVLRQTERWLRRWGIDSSPEVTLYFRFTDKVAWAKMAEAWALVDDHPGILAGAVAAGIPRVLAPRYPYCAGIFGVEYVDDLAGALRALLADRGKED